MHLARFQRPSKSMQKVEYNIRHFAWTLKELFYISHPIIPASFFLSPSTPGLPAVGERGVPSELIYSDIPAAEGEEGGGGEFRRGFSSNRMTYYSFTPSSKPSVLFSERSLYGLFEASVFANWDY